MCRLKCLFLLPDKLPQTLIFIHNKMSTQKEQLADDVRNRQHFKGNVRDLLNKPHADIGKYGDCQYHGVRSGGDGLFDGSTHDNCDHCRKVSQQKDEIQRMKRTVYLDECRNTVYDRKRNLFVIYWKNSRTGGDREHNERKHHQSTVQPFGVVGICDVQNDHQHRKR